MYYAEAIASAFPFIKITTPEAKKNVKVFRCKNNPNVHVQAHLHSLQTADFMIE